jgi:hypothetical protein
MMFKVGLENNMDGHSIAWILGHPGCFVHAKDGPQALAAVPQAIQEYRSWISRHTQDSWFPSSGTDYQLEETWECYSLNDGYELDENGEEIDAWFRDDWIPLNAEDIEHGLLLLRWGREELLNTVGNLSADILERTYPNERWSIASILNHIGGADWWYLDRLGLAFSRQDVPGQPFERLEKVRQRLIDILPGLAGSKQVIGVAGEFWSPRKLLRRAVWHEYDHISHIRKLL